MLRRNVISLTLGKGGELARGAGAMAKLIAKEGKSTTLQLLYRAKSPSPH